MRRNSVPEDVCAAIAAQPTDEEISDLGRITLVSRSVTALVVNPSAIKSQQELMDALTGLADEAGIKLKGEVLLEACLEAGIKAEKALKTLR